IQACLGADDLFGRYGGEEFLLVTSDTTAEDAMALAERVRAEVGAELATLLPDLRELTTLSVGVAVFEPDGHDIRPEQLIEIADAALYQAKRQGRNRVRCAA